jgi:glutamate 5-kinase
LGSVTVDAGAARALAKGSSLLPAGIKAVSGTFERGDAVDVFSGTGARIGRGLAAYSSADAAVIAGHRSEDFEALLGWRGRDEVIHRDDLVIF